MSLTFRTARRDDLPQIVRMLADDILGAGREVVSDPPAQEYFAAFEAVDKNPNDFLVVAELNGDLVGCAQLTILHGLSRKGMKRGHIEAVRVASGHRGGGIGEALIKELVRLARAADCGLVQLTSSVERDRAVAFYERLGFRVTHKGMKLEF
ncbi:MAG: GNAT family N-acetyltransferase [Pseudomonadota bacterium]